MKIKSIIRVTVLASVIGFYNSVWASPNGIIIDIFKIQTKAFQDTTQSTIRNLDSQFLSMLQNAIALDQTNYSGYFDDLNSVLKNKRALINAVNEAYKNMGAGVRIKDTLSKIVDSIDAANAVALIPENILNLAGGVESINSAADDLFDLIKSNPSVINIIDPDRPRDFFETIAQTHNDREIYRVLEKILDSSSDINESYKSVWDSIISIAKLRTAADMQKQLRNEVGMKLFIQDYILNLWMNPESGIISSENKQLVDRYVQIIVVNKIPIIGWELVDENSGETVERLKIKIPENYVVQEYVTPLSNYTTPVKIEEPRISLSSAGEVPRVVSGTVTCVAAPCTGTNVVITPTSHTPVAEWGGMMTSVNVLPQSRFYPAFGAKTGQFGSLDVPTRDSFTINVLGPNIPNGTSVTAQAVGSDRSHFWSSRFSELDDTRYSRFSHTAWGRWTGSLQTTDDATGLSHTLTSGLWAIGTRTPEAAMPRQGSATFAGGVVADHISATGVTAQNGVTGHMGLTANFASNSVSGYMSLARNGVAWANPSFSNLAINKVASSSTDVGRFSIFTGALTASNGGGALYGLSLIHI